MTWQAIFIVFVTLYSAFNVINPPKEETIKNSKEIYQKASVDQSDYENKIVPSYVFLTEHEDYISQSDIIYQTIVSYIMEYNRTLEIQEVTAIGQAILKYGIEQRVDPFLLTAQMSAESSFNRMAVSSSGARGLGQMMPFNFDTYQITDPHDIEQGARAQATKMRWLLDMFENNLHYSLAGYYQGHNAVKANIGNPFRSDTQQYIDKIIDRYNKLKNFS
jgi:soluble lytic murein transglycosylase-like protein